MAIHTVTVIVIYGASPTLATSPSVFTTAGHRVKGYDYLDWLLFFLMMVFFEILKDISKDAVKRIFFGMMRFCRRGFGFSGDTNSVRNKKILKEALRAAEVASRERVVGDTGCSAQALYTGRPDPVAPPAIPPAVYPTLAPVEVHKTCMLPDCPGRTIAESTLRSAHLRLAIINLVSCNMNVLSLMSRKEHQKVMFRFGVLTPYTWDIKPLGLSSASALTDMRTFVKLYHIPITTAGSGRTKERIFNDILTWFDTTANAERLPRGGF